MNPQRSDWDGRNHWIYRTIRVLISLIVTARIVRIEGRDGQNIPKVGPVVLAINHQSNLDPLLVGWAAPRPINIPGKVELFRIPVLRWIIEQLGCYPVDRDATDPGSLRRSLMVLRQGLVLAVFPEGTRTRTGQLGRFDETITRLAMRERAQVVPVGLSGTGNILPPGKRLPRLGRRVIVRFGVPIDVALDGRTKPTPEQLAASTQQIRDAVQSLLDKDLALVS